MVVALAFGPGFGFGFGVAGEVDVLVQPGGCAAVMLVGVGGRGRVG